MLLRNLNGVHDRCAQWIFVQWNERRWNRHKFWLIYSIRRYSGVKRSGHFKTSNKRKENAPLSIIILFMRARFRAGNCNHFVKWIQIAATLKSISDIVRGWKQVLTGAGCCPWWFSLVYGREGFWKAGELWT